RQLAVPPALTPRQPGTADSSLPDPPSRRGPISRHGDHRRPHGNLRIRPTQPASPVVLPDAQRRWRSGLLVGRLLRVGSASPRIHLRIARECAITVPSGSFSAGSFVCPVAARSSSRDPLRRKGIGLPCAAITLS